MDVVITPDPASAAVAAADIVEEHVRPGPMTLGLATGSTPVATYRELIRRHREAALSFARVRAFLLDEYLGLTPDDEESYHRTIRREFTESIDIPDDEVFGPDGTSSDPDRAARLYDEAIRSAGGVDLQLLGIGSNGHIGFNEPGTPLDGRTHSATLHRQTVSDNARFFGGSTSAVPVHVLTQGLGTIRDARALLLIATGEAKAEAVAAMIEGPADPSCPASVLQLHAHATVILDEAAASRLGPH